MFFLKPLEQQRFSRGPTEAAIECYVAPRPWLRPARCRGSCPGVAGCTCCCRTGHRTRPSFCAATDVNLPTMRHPRCHTLASGFSALPRLTRTRSTHPLPRQGSAAPMHELPAKARRPRWTLVHSSPTTDKTHPTTLHCRRLCCCCWSYCCCRCDCSGCHRCGACACGC